ncbi:hypothetical protein [Delftia lacustris]|uniref:hypothetical protein n=1 Tax=Delftia lacustris TaxID=558537 RepID=UPI001FCD27AF|nr:hypothetical protein [Delftia lacustris]BDE75222.1 hypothetical protein HQS1_63460 [Delftia lacustris]
MHSDMHAALAASEHRVIQGIALLSDEARAILSATPDDFRRTLGAALYDIHAPEEASDYGRGLHFGRALGILGAGAALSVLTYHQLEVLMASLKAMHK